MSDTEESQSSYYQEDQKDQKDAESLFNCPLYVNFMKNRCLNTFEKESQLIAMVPIPSKLHPPKFWIQRGVSLLCYSQSLEDKWWWWDRK